MRDDCYVGCTHRSLQDNLESTVHSMFTVPNVFGAWHRTPTLTTPGPVYPRVQVTPMWVEVLTCHGFTHGCGTYPPQSPCTSEQYTYNYYLLSIHDKLVVFILLALPSASSHCGTCHRHVVVITVLVWTWHCHLCCCAGTGVGAGASAGVGSSGIVIVIIMQRQVQV